MGLSGQKKRGLDAKSPLPDLLFGLSVTAITHGAGAATAATAASALFFFYDVTGDHDKQHKQDDANGKRSAICL